jgi:hypothetical protein
LRFDRQWANAFMGVLVDRLDRYSTSLEEDRKILEQLLPQHDQTTRRKKMAIQLRIGEKEILREAIERMRDHLSAHGPMPGI